MRTPVEHRHRRSHNPINERLARKEVDGGKLDDFLEAAGHVGHSAVERDGAAFGSVRDECWSWRDRDGAEEDLLCERGIRRKAVGGRSRATAIPSTSAAAGVRNYVMSTLDGC